MVSPTAMVAALVLVALGHVAWAADVGGHALVVDWEKLEAETVMGGPVNDMALLVRMCFGVHPRDVFVVHLIAKHFAISCWCAALQWQVPVRIPNQAGNADSYSSHQQRDRIGIPFCD